MKPRNEEAQAPEKGLLSHRKKKNYTGSDINTFIPNATELKVTNVKFPNCF
jgi:hypothetical protein